MIYKLKPIEVDPKRKLSETETRIVWLMTHTLDLATLLRDGTVPKDKRKDAANAVVEWMSESIDLGQQIINAARSLEVEDESPTEPDRDPTDDVDEPADTAEPEPSKLLLPAEPLQEATIQELGPFLGHIQPGSIHTLTPEGSPGEVIVCHSNYMAAAVRAFKNRSGFVDVRGDCSAGTNVLGGGSTPWAGDAGWHDGPLTFGFRGLDHGDAVPRLGEFAMRQRMNSGDEHGINHLWLQDLDVQARYRTCISGPKGANLGQLTLRGVGLRHNPASKARGEYGGFGFKWGMRLQARCQYDIDGLICDPVQEHAIYVDSPSGDTRFWNVTSQNSWRTAIQVVSRSLDNPGRCGHGTLWVKNLKASYTSQGEGGAAFTVAGGHDGDIIVDGLTVDERHSGKHVHGAVAIWVDAGPTHGAYLWGDLREAGSAPFTSPIPYYRAYPRVVLTNLDIGLPSADRNPVSVRGARILEVGSHSIVSPKEHFVFDSPFAVAGNLASLDGGPVGPVDGMPDMVMNGEEKFWE